MEYFDKEYCIEITGSYACFTQPTLTADYVSFPVPTPFALRNILQSIFWVKGATQWEITKIEVLKPIQFEVISLPKNTTPSSLDISLNQTKISMTEKEERTEQTSSSSTPNETDLGSQSRLSCVLKDVAYRVYARLVFIPIRKRSLEDQQITKVKLARKKTRDENPGKYYGEFERRIKKGNYFKQPYLGMQGYNCSFKLVDHPESMGIKQDLDLGLLLYDLDFEVNTSAPTPLFFHAKMEQGTIHIPSKRSEEILR